MRLTLNLSAASYRDRIDSAEAGESDKVEKACRRYGMTTGPSPAAGYPGSRSCAVACRLEPQARCRIIDIAGPEILVVGDVVGLSTSSNWWFFLFGPKYM